jgi:diaminopimelate decarboxylase
LVFHGNNKSEAELRLALDARVGRLVVDSLDEIDRIEMLVSEGLEAPDVLVRITPGVEATRTSLSAPARTIRSSASRSPPARQPTR